MTFEGQRNRDLALSLSKGGRGLQACFDKLSTGCWAGWTKAVSSAVRAILDSMASHVGVEGDANAHARTAEGDNGVLVIGREHDQHARLGCERDFRRLIGHAVHMRARPRVDEHDRALL